MNYNKSTCPKDKIWFIEGGKCGTTLECIQCDDVPEEAKFAFTIQEDDSQVTTLTIEDMSCKCISITQLVIADVTDEPNKEEQVYLDFEMLTKINDIVSKIPFEESD